MLARLVKRGYCYHLSRKRLDESHILVWCGIIDVLSIKSAAICVCCQASAVAEFSPSPNSWLIHDIYLEVILL